MTQLSNATLTTIESTYFDDYDENKKYYRILFRPSVALQARELNQIQSIAQNQISRFGDHVFKEGSIVDGVSLSRFSRTPFVRLVDDFLTNTYGFDNIESVTDGFLITNGNNSNTAVRAVTFLGKKGFQSNYPVTNRLYLQYIYTGKDGSNNDVTSFSNGQTLYIYSANQEPLGTLSNTNIIATINVFTTNATANAAVGESYMVGVSDGVIYQKGFFQKVDKQYTLVNEFESNANSAIVGFETTESIVTENQDSTLNDNANGSSNYNAPGAHRLKLTPTLVVKSKTDTANNKNFFSIVEFDGNNAVRVSTDPMYSAIGDAMAKRTYEESGDYTVIPNSIETTATTLDANIFFYEVSSGLSYVKGSRVELVGTRKIAAPRSLSTKISQNQALTANYGNYVFCDEVLGAVNFDSLGEVAIYDTAFNAISDNETLSGGTSGSVIGYANIKSVVWYSGKKGASDAQYYVYLFNIRMNKGKSFENDAKAFYAASASTGYTNFKADIVLENSKAVLKDSTFTPMLFNTGLSAIKSLTPNGSSQDTTFYFRKTTSGTFSNSGVVSFSLSGGLSSGTGGEQLYNTNSRDYNIVLTANAYTSNLSPTSNVTTNSAAGASSTVIGNNTKFEQDFVVGDWIRISSATDSNPKYYQITAISSNTSMSITPNVTANSVGNTYQKYFPSGSYLNITDSMLAINAAANSVTITTGYTLASGGSQTVYAQYPVSRTLAREADKTVKKNTVVKINCSNNVATSIGPWCLGLPDVLKIKEIYIGTANAYSNTSTNRASWFTLDNGQKDDYYDLATLSINPTYQSELNGNSTLLVYLDHLVPDTSQGIGYFSVDSYPTSNDGITSNSSTITIAEIPIYNSKTSGVSYDLRNTIDFRPYKGATANSLANTDPANTQISTNPLSSNSNTFSVSVYGQYQPEVDSVFTADYEYYLPRKDLIILGSGGAITVANGVAENFPKLPINTVDGTAIAETYVPPFPSLTTREAETYNRKDLATKITVRSNKRYTMKDIGTLENRISKLEYYVVLSTLEKQAKDLSIPDSTGKDRFKNGIFADPFNNHSFGNVNDIEYKISIDPKKSIARPDFKNHFVEYQYSNTISSNITKKGPYVTLPYTHETMAEQRFASKYRIATESVWSWKGNLYIAPSYDSFVDEGSSTSINATLNLSTAEINSIQSTNSKIFGAQATADQTTANNIGQVSNSTTPSNTANEIASTSVTNGNRLTSGDYITDVTAVPYMRSIDVAFYANNLRPNSTLHVFFDGVNVDEHITPGVLAIDPADITYSLKDKNMVTTTAPRGITSSNPLVANSSGSVAGMFTVPADTFRLGDRVLKITNIDNIYQGTSAQYTTAEAVFTSSGLSVKKGSFTLTAIQPQPVPRPQVSTPLPDTGTATILGAADTASSNNSSIVVTTTTLTAQTPTNSGNPAQATGPTTQVIPAVEGPQWFEDIGFGIWTNDGFVNMGGGFNGNGDGGNGGGGGDPIAQSFVVNPPQLPSGAPVSSSGQFITKIDVYFKQKDSVKGCTCWIVEVVNGVPDYSRLFGYSHLDSADVNVSDDASVATSFELEHPVFLTSGVEYAFIIQPDGDSPDYLIWTAEVGGFDVVTNEQIFTAPFDGVMFISSNRRSWTTIQTEDIKFKIHRAKFVVGNGYVGFYNEDDEYLTINNVTKNYTGAQITVGDVVYTSNSTVANTSSGAPFGIVQSYNESTGELILDTTTPGFVGNNGIQIHRVFPSTNTSLVYSGTSNTWIASANVATVDDLKYHSIIPKFATMMPQGTNMNMSYLGTDTSYNNETSYITVQNESVNELFDKERIIVGKSNEDSEMSGFKSSVFAITLSTIDPYVSPVVDLRKRSAIFVENIINNSTTNEEYRYGSALSKYISKKVVLADGQDAEDLKVYISAFRPINSDIKIYAKVQSSDDPEDFDTKLWTEMNYTSNGNVVYSSSQNLEEYIEYEFSIPEGTVTTQRFNANSAVNNSGDYVSFTNNSFANNQLVLYYTATGNNALSGLSNNTFYFVNNANTTTLTLASTQGGANINITASSTVEDGHYLQGYSSNAAFLNNDNSGIVEYYNNAGAKQTSFKYFALKMVLLSSDRVNVPRVNDIRAIALQK